MRLVPVQGWSTLAGSMARASSGFLPWSREGRELAVSFC